MSNEKTFFSLELDEMEDEDLKVENSEMKDARPWGRRRRRGGSWFRQNVIKPVLSSYCQSQCNHCVNNSSTGCKITKVACKCP